MQLFQKPLLKISKNNKTSPPHNPRQTSTLTGYDLKNMDTAQRHGRKRASANSTLAKAGVSCFYDSFVVNQISVFQMKFCSEIPRLRQSANRYL